MGPGTTGPGIQGLGQWGLDKVRRPQFAGNRNAARGRAVAASTAKLLAMTRAREEQSRARHAGRDVPGCVLLKFRLPRSIGGFPHESRRIAIRCCSQFTIRRKLLSGRLAILGVPKDLRRRNLGGRSFARRPVRNLRHVRVPFISTQSLRVTGNRGPMIRQPDANRLASGR
jgi:hypothetical protein